MKIRVNMLKLGMTTPNADNLPATIPISQIKNAVRENMRPDRDSSIRRPLKSSNE